MSLSPHLRLTWLFLGSFVSCRLHRVRIPVPFQTVAKGKGGKGKGKGNGKGKGGGGGGGGGGDEDDLDAIMAAIEGGGDAAKPKSAVRRISRMCCVSCVSSASPSLSRSCGWMTYVNTHASIVLVLARGLGSRHWQHAPSQACCVRECPSVVAFPCECFAPRPTAVASCIETRIESQGYVCPCRNAKERKRERACAVKHGV